MTGEDPTLRTSWFENETVCRAPDPEPIVSCSWDGPGAEAPAARRRMAWRVPPSMVFPPLEAPRGCSDRRGFVALHRPGPRRMVEVTARLVWTSRALARRMPSMLT